MVPKKGQKCYGPFLRRQRKARKEARTAKKIADAKAVLSTLLAAKDAEIQALVRRSNAHMRTSATNANNAKQENIRNDMLTKQLRKTRKELATATDELKKTTRNLNSWLLWWSRVESRARPHTLRHLRALGRPRPPAPDGCWGGGQ